MAQQLSPRQADIIRLVADGKTTKEIGKDLAIADSTVNWHVANILLKLGASSRAGAVAVALRAGLLPGERAIDDPRPARGS